MLTAVMVILPSLGPLADHHFAERQPYHAHLGADSGHTHDYGDLHAHTSDRSGGANPALPNLQVSSAGSAIAIPSDSELVRRLTIEPDTVFTIPPAADSVLRSVYASPPHRPPRDRLQVSVAL